MPTNDQGHGTGVTAMFAAEQSASFVYFPATIEMRLALLFMDDFGNTCAPQRAKPGILDD